MFSGNRDAEGRLNLTTDYEALYSTLRRGRAAQLGLPADWPSQFDRAIRVDDIVTATPFSAAIYTEFNPDWKERINGHNQPGTAFAANSPKTYGATSSHQ
jgi:hypothetical protein